MSDDHGHNVNYLLIFIFLCFCTLASAICDVLPIPKLAIMVLVLGIATAKALLVMLNFMHLRFEGRWKYVLLAPTTILAIGLPLALMPDVGLHYYMVDVPQAEAVITQHTDHDADEHGANEPAAPGKQDH
jgi:cytochrome c oxidase subunit 4